MIDKTSLLKLSVGFLLTEHLALPLLFILDNQCDLNDSKGNDGQGNTDDESEPPGDRFNLVCRLRVDRQVAEAFALQGG
jgi:hypothetical protein